MMSVDANRPRHPKRDAPLTFKLRQLFGVMTIASIVFAIFALCGVDDPAEVIALSWFTFCGLLYVRAAMIERGEASFTKLLVGVSLLGLVAGWLYISLSMLRDYGR